MNADSLHLAAPWDEVKEKLKEINITLTDDDLQYTPGEASALIQRLSRKLHKTDDEVRELIESVSTNKGKAS